jgi:hypothetical protein
MNLIFKEKNYPVLTCTSSGEFEGFYKKDSNGIWRRSLKVNPGRCILAIPPGIASLRHLTLDTVASKQAQEMINTELDSTLYLPVEEGFSFEKIIKGKERTTVFTAWIEKRFLLLCRQTATNLKLVIDEVLVPELAPGNGTPSLLCFEQGRQVTAYFASLPQLPVCFSVPGMPADKILSLLMDHCAVKNLPVPEHIMIWNQKPDSDERWRQILNSAGLSVSPLMIKGWEDFLTHQNFAQIVSWMRSSNKPFSEFINFGEKESITLKDYFLLAVAGSVTLAASGLFFATYYIDLKKDVAVLEKTTASVTRTTEKAKKATTLIREFHEKNTMLRKLSGEKTYSLALIRDIIDAGSEEIQLENLSITMPGEINIQGRATDELFITSVVTKLEESPLIMDCTLTIIEKKAQSHVYSFSIQGKTQNWDHVFKKENQEL